MGSPVAGSLRLRLALEMGSTFGAAVALELVWARQTLRGRSGADFKLHRLAARIPVEGDDAHIGLFEEDPERPARISRDGVVLPFKKVLECSAKTGEGVRDVMNEIIKVALHHKMGGGKKKCEIL